MVLFYCMVCEREDLVNTPVWRLRPWTTALFICAISVLAYIPSVHQCLIPFIIVLAGILVVTLSRNIQSWQET